ncbi:flagella basal body P-ring formation protein FlgA [Methylobacillus arboreus]|uniref:flagella basal body P-ring formation protein FlgA n=1 Tax=Methylobacillus arboreus TaxID=755170 RepID=UPI001E603DA9|nr:flagella basal body P-ring formation protein FlgA [Methylobacillus arboreus]MCB5191875.1 flagella basal body P-ring formation protein FlgA [Methylobacillus arboreus]
MLRFVSIILISLVASPLMAGDEVYIELRRQATVDRPDVAVQEIANVIADDPGKRDIEGLRLKLETLAASQRLAREDIESALVKRFAWLRGKIAWGGATHVEIFARKRKVSLENGIAQARQWLQDEVSSNYEYPVEYRLTSKNLDIDMPAGKVSQLPATQEFKMTGNRMELPLDIYVDEQWVARRQLQFALHPLRSVNKTESIQGQSSPVALDKHETAELLHQAGVSKHQVVKVLMHQGSINIETEGQAERDAKVGETLMVKRLDGPELFLAQVVEPGTVMVKE